ncbi:MAG: ComF family protein [Flavobacteriales bacterium]|jgi:ComF family protein|nr:ComF family protein [Flavobacteriales bacterium]MBT3962650.1 ComF family protein [Flavobacteriales bacterium]MBT4705813.1 ComF family protein [Flavobacteriales bacterium]MBT4931623.1 ComF family protein [Flavobacteriales bacterium]MBT5133850.1 ComF family protein [Flavobacteriales bacterium]
MFITQTNRNLKKYFDAFTHLVYPIICKACNGVLDEEEEFICHHCLRDLPKTYNWQIENNRVERLFWGKVEIQHAASFLYFTKGGIVQELLHALKYHGQEKVGSYLGSLFAGEIKDSSFAKADLIIPVPLHPKKMKLRGYNQCASATRVLGDGLNLRYRPDLLRRKSHAESQTKLDRYSRWQNVEEGFEVVDESEIMGKHVVLVDDVVTTGSTLEACANSILSAPNTKVSILTLAVPMPV